MKYIFDKTDWIKDVIAYRQGNNWMCVENGCIESPFPWWVQTKKQVKEYLNEQHAPITFRITFAK